MNSHTSPTGGSPDLRRTEAYDYDLPPGRIARYPVERRDASRLLVVPREAVGTASHPFHDAGNEVSTPALPPFRDLHFSDLPSLMARGDLLVLNESRVLPLRLLGRGSGGAEREVLLLRPAPGEGDQISASRWEALVRPGDKLRPGREVVISQELRVVIEESLPDGGRIVRLVTPLSVAEVLERVGRIPLPPYMEREDEELDRERYQTVYARDPGSVAAPTAGLHFTPELLQTLEERGVGIARVTLHVGPGTFRPVDSDAIDSHRMHGERWHLPPETAAAILATRGRGGRVWAVGTTVVRTLESAAGGEMDRGGAIAGGDGAIESGGAGDAIAGGDGAVASGAAGGAIVGGDAGILRLANAGETHLFISPGYRFRVVDALITNFHLPRSTLLMLVSAFAGYQTTMSAYAHAIDRGYRFYSYGDAMVILPGEAL